MISKKYQTVDFAKVAEIYNRETNSDYAGKALHSLYKNHPERPMCKKVKDIILRGECYRPNWQKMQDEIRTKHNRHVTRTSLKISYEMYSLITPMMGK